MIDHLVYGTPDLAATVEELNGRFGIELSPGGQHLGLGTRNYRADLGDRRYLEVVGPDPEQRHHVGGRLFGVDSLSEPRLVTWAARTDDLAALHRRAAERGSDVGPIRAMHRDSADGFPISWLMTPPLAHPAFGGLIPFFVEWGADSPHPADRAARGIRLVSLTALAPEVAPVQRRLAALDQYLPVVSRAEPGLRAVLEAPAGRVVLE
jgi:hypothetical protein